jgi:hypothetical protein
MAQPTPYDRTHNFTEELGNQHGINLDQEFDDIELTVDEICRNLALIQRDDGRLANQSVSIDTLDPTVRRLFAAAGANIRGAWVTATAYAVKDVVSVSGSGTYICAVAHTSGVFATDLASGKWMALEVYPTSRSADTFAAMQALTNSQDKDVIQTAGHTTVLDGGGDLFRYDAASSDAADFQTVVPTNNLGRYKRIKPELDLRKLGFVNNAATVAEQQANSNAWNTTAWPWMVANPGGRVIIPRGTWIGAPADTSVSRPLFNISGTQGILIDGEGTLKLSSDLAWNDLSGPDWIMMLGVGTRDFTLGEGVTLDGSRAAILAKIQTTLTVQANAGDTIISVVNGDIARNGQALTIVLDNGVLHNPTQISATANTITISAGIPVGRFAAVGAVVSQQVSATIAHSDLMRFTNFATYGQVAGACNGIQIAGKVVDGPSAGVYFIGDSGTSEYIEDFVIEPTARLTGHYNGGLVFQRFIRKAVVRAAEISSTNGQAFDQEVTGGAGPASDIVFEGVRMPDNGLTLTAAPSGFTAALPMERFKMTGCHIAGGVKLKAMKDSIITGNTFIGKNGYRALEINRYHENCDYSGNEIVGAHNVANEAALYVTGLAPTVTSISVAAVATDTVLTLANPNGNTFADGASLGLLLDDNTVHLFTQQSHTGTSITMSAAIPGGKSAAIGRVIHNRDTVVDRMSYCDLSDNIVIDTVGRDGMRVENFGSGNRMQNLRIKSTTTGSIGFIARQTSNSGVIVSDLKANGSVANFTTGATISTANSATPIINVDYSGWQFDNVTTNLNIDNGAVTGTPLLVVPFPQLMLGMIQYGVGSTTPIANNHSGRQTHWFIGGNAGGMADAVTLTGSPEGVVTARIGSTCRRTDGGIGTSLYLKTSGTGNTGWRSVGALRGTATYNPPSIIPGGRATTTVTVTGAAVGDTVSLGFSNALTGITLRGEVTSANTVTATLTNPILVISGSATYDPPNIVATTGSTTTTVTATGAAVGDPVTAGFSQALSGLEMDAEVTATNTVTVTLRNRTAGDINLASGTLTVHVSAVGAAVDLASGTLTAHVWPA